MITSIKQLVPLSKKKKNQQQQLVPWWRLVWFPEAIHKQAFILWLVFNFFFFIKKVKIREIKTELAAPGQLGV
jgi:hypothetical protein